VLVIVDSVKLWALSPAPIAAAVVTVELDAAGLVTLKPVGKVHAATCTPHSPVPGGGALLTVRLADALWPVSSASMKRLVVVLLNVPVVDGVTFTLMTQLLFAASVPLEKL